MIGDVEHYSQNELLLVLWREQVARIDLDLHFLSLHLGKELLRLIDCATLRVEILVVSCEYIQQQFLVEGLVLIV